MHPKALSPAPQAKPTASRERRRRWFRSNRELQDLVRAQVHGLNSTCVSVALHLARRANPLGLVRASYTDLARATGRSMRTIVRAIAILRTHVCPAGRTFLAVVRSHDWKRRRAAEHRVLVGWRCPRDRDPTRPPLPFDRFPTPEYGPPAPTPEQWSAMFRAERSSRREPLAGEQPEHLGTGATAHPISSQNVTSSFRVPVASQPGNPGSLQRSAATASASQTAPPVPGPSDARRDGAPPERGAGAQGAPVSRQEPRPDPARTEIAQPALDPSPALDAADGRQSALGSGLKEPCRSSSPPDARTFVSGENSGSVCTVAKSTPAPDRPPNPALERFRQWRALEIDDGNWRPRKRR